MAAIPITEYIDVGTKVLTGGVAEVDFSALVFTKESMKLSIAEPYATSLADQISDYENGKVITLTKDAIEALFDAGPLTTWCGKYFGYSNDGRAPSIVNLFKVGSGVTAKQAYDAALDNFTNFGSIAFVGKDFTPQSLQTVATENESTGYALSVSCVSTAYSTTAGYFADCKNVFLAQDVDETIGEDTVNLGSWMFCAWCATSNYSANQMADSPDFKSFPGATATVTDASSKRLRDAARVNYIGKTQTHGLQRQFMQPGLMMDGTDAGVWRDAQWIKAMVEIGWINLATSDKVPANYVGCAKVRSLVVDIATRAIDAGAILVDKPYDNETRAKINQYAQDNGAADEVESTGYFVSTKILKIVEGNNTRYHIEYTLIYGKGDHIAKVVGSHIAA